MSFYKNINIYPIFNNGEEIPVGTIGRIVNFGKDICYITKEGSLGRCCKCLFNGKYKYYTCWENNKHSKTVPICKDRSDNKIVYFEKI